MCSQVLMLAAAAGRLQTCKFLVERGASVYVTTAQPLIDKDALVNGKGTTLRQPGYIGAPLA